MNATSIRPLGAAARRWLAALLLILVGGVVMVLFFMLTVATDHRAFEADGYVYLVWLNVGVAGLLGVLLLWLAYKLASRWRRKRFGSRLQVKLAAIFALVGFLPGLLIYVVSYQFVSRSIETWFDVRVETALSAGLNLGRTTIETLAADLASKARGAALRLGEQSDVAAALSLEGLRVQMQAHDMVLWSATGRAIGSAGESRFELLPAAPAPELLRLVRAQRSITRIEGLEELETLEEPQQVLQLPAAQLPRIRVLVLVEPHGFGIGLEPRFLQVVSILPAALVADALSVQLANREYQERALAREGLRSMYIGTLTLALFLATFGAVLLALLLGQQLMRPLLVLAEGMRDVARGDLTPKQALPTKDELAGLTRTFAHMTQELLEARQAVQRSIGQVDAARANLQTLLDNLSAGVVVLDAQQRLLSANPGAMRILRVPLNAHLGQGLHAVPGLRGFADFVQQQFDRFLADSVQHEGQHWQQPVDLQPGNEANAAQEGQRQALTLIARGALLPSGEQLLVFDDVSEIISAQRAQAWAEVARRLAHEIKNPLTPIQLAAERLAMKLQPKLEGAELVLLDKSVKTIVDQVDAMKRLVNEFRDYARLPAAQLEPLDLNAQLRDIVALYEAADVPVRLDLQAGLPPVLADAQQVRQVVHNLVQNAQDATPPGAPAVLLRTRASDGGRWVRLQVLDHGPGFAEAILKRAFEPYVTSKAKGTGLGLAVVKKIIDEHGGRIDIGHWQDDEGQGGAQVSLSLRVATLQQN
ncbi:sensor histidine kinase [Serpentinimonas maccroryi]|uniref:sensor histidine kinase n=1 Tax=Serpentinimonas maccroryi TaxID=1458426 RepID=UPI002033F9B2|nr:ATP-binding protein [Serpentinimonas maccroryi]MCM2479650.1 HAMP domain-containing protein [Serpentinimonas maccroryi]